MGNACESRDPKSIAELAESRTVNSYRLKTDATDVAQVIDFLIKEGRVKDEKPKVEPGLVAGLRAEQPVVTHQEHASSTGQNTPTEAPSPPEHEEEHAEQAEEPTPTLVLAYLQPILKTGIAATELRRKIGHEKGKAWTAMFNEMLDTIIDLRNTHTPNKQLYENMQNTYGTRLGSLVQGTMTLRKNTEGRIVITQENEFLCSNPKVPSNAPSNPPAKPSKNGVEAVSGSPTTPVNTGVTEEDRFWAVDGPGTMDDALNHI